MALAHLQCRIDMGTLKFVQWILGAVVGFYVYKGLLGKMREGDLLKAVMAAVAWLALVLVPSRTVRLD